MHKGKEQLFKTLNYKPLPQQLAFHNSEAKYRGFIGGLGSGKSHCGVFESIYTTLTWPGSTGVILAPTNKLLKDSTQKAFLNFCPTDVIKNLNRSEQRLKLINKSDILFRSCEDEKTIDRLRNIEIGWFWIDEARGVPEYAWKVLVGRNREKNAPRIGFLTTTPKGFNWIHKRFVDKPTKEYFYVHSSSTENTHLPEDYLTDIKAEYSGTFAQQEIEGKFVNFEGIVYSDFSRRHHILNAAYFIDKENKRGIKILNTDKRILFKDIIIGIDWGFTNPTAIAVVGIDNDNRMYIIDEFYQSKIKIDELKDVIQGYKDKYNYSSAYADPSEPQFIETLNDAGLSINKAINDIMPGISEVSSRLKIREDERARLYITKDCINTLKEFESYRYPDRKEDKPEQEKPVKVMDHMMDAIRYVSMGIKLQASGLLEFI